MTTTIATEEGFPLFILAEGPANEARKAEVPAPQLADWRRVIAEFQRVQEEMQTAWLLAEWGPGKDLADPRLLSEFDSFATDRSPENFKAVYQELKEGDPIKEDDALILFSSPKAVRYLLVTPRTYLPGTLEKMIGLPYSPNFGAVHRERPL